MGTDSMSQTTHNRRIYDAFARLLYEQAQSALDSAGLLIPIPSHSARDSEPC